MDDIGLEHKFIGHFLKRWADRYAIKGETKGGMVALMHETFIVTSQYKIQQIWDDAETQ